MEGLVYIVLYQAVHHMRGGAASAVSLCMQWGALHYTMGNVVLLNTQV